MTVPRFCYTIKSFVPFLLFVAIPISGFAQKVHFDKNKWTEYIEGDMPLVISVPHGGKITSDTLPIRSCKNAVTTLDGFTIELAREFQEEFKKKYGLTPHIIISHISRKHVDHNREMDKGGTCGNDVMNETWQTFHNFIDTAIRAAEKKYGKVVYIDLHGHAHTNYRLELGYVLRSDALKAIVEDNYGHLKEAKESSVQNILNANKNITLKEMMIGESAFGTLMSSYGIPATPSKQDPYPKDGEPFLSRGYNIIRFAGPKYPNVFGVQIECDRNVRVTQQGRTKFATAFVHAVLKYIEIYTGVKIADMK